MAEEFALSDAFDSTPTAAVETPTPSVPDVSGSAPVEKETQTDDSDSYFAPAWFNEIQLAMDVADPSRAPAPPPPPPSVPHMGGYGGVPPAGYGYPPPQQPRQPQGGRDPRFNEIDRMFEDPRGYISSIMNESASRQAQEYAGYTQREIARVMHANAQNAMYNVKGNVDRAYDSYFNRDDAFRSNEEVRNIVDNTLSGLAMQAANASYHGNYAPARMFEDPRLYAGVMAAAKAMAGVRGVNPEPAVPFGASTGRVSHRQESGSRVQLPPDMEEVARNMGPAFRERLEADYAEAMRLGDISWE